MTKEINSLPRCKRLAILLGFLAFQLLFFPFDKTSFGFIAIPFFGTLGFFLAVVTAHLVNFLAFKLPEDTRRKYIYSAVSFSLLSVFASVFRASFVDRFLLSALSSFWWVISFYLFVIPSSRFGSYSEILAIPFRFVSPVLEASVKLINAISKVSLNGSRATKSFSKILIGLAITIPAAGLLLILLSSADPIFSYYLEKIFTFDFTVSEVAAQFLWRVFFSICFLVFVGVLVLMKIKSNFISPASNLSPKNSPLVAPYLMLTATLSIILMAFLAIQIKYLAIQDLSDLTSFGISTFSEYVRRGFMELVLATALVYSISGAGLVLYRSFKPHKIHLAVNSILIILNLALAAMAYKRVYLYMTEHGLTHMRIYGLMILLIIVFFLVTLFIRYFVKNHKLYIAELLGASLIVFIFGIANVDYLLARIAPPTVNNEVDFNYLSRLSADDPHSWISVYEDINENTLPVLEKESFSLDEKILITRGDWALSRIYYSVGTLVHKYGKEEEKEVFSEEHYRFNAKGGFLKTNIKEYSAYLLLRDEIDFKKLKETREKVQSVAFKQEVRSELPEDIYQFMGEW